MAVQIGAKPDSGFDDPLGMLVDCHRRIERFLGILCLVVERAQAQVLPELALTDEEKQAVVAALAYFRAGGVRHTADEEESLFPRLRAACAESLAEIGELEDDHQHANELHAAVDALYTAWMTDETLGPEQTQGLLKATRELRDLYAAHIRVEEKEIFPRAAEMLDHAAIAAIGQEFKTRRQ